MFSDFTAIFLFQHFTCHTIINDPNLLHYFFSKLILRKWTLHMRQGWHTCMVKHYLIISRVIFWYASSWDAFINWQTLSWLLNWNLTASLQLAPKCLAHECKWSVLFKIQKQQFSQLKAQSDSINFQSTEIKEIKSLSLAKYELCKPLIWLFVYGHEALCNVL